MPVIASENFNGYADYTLLQSLSNWAKHPTFTPNISIVQSAIISLGDIRSLYYNTVAPVTADQGVQARMLLAPFGVDAGKEWFLGCRLDTTQFTGYLGGWKDGKWYIYRVNNGVFTELASLAQSLVSGLYSTKTVFFSVRSALLSLLVDGAEILSVTDTSPISSIGRVGLLQGSNSLTLDDWSAEYYVTDSVAPTLSSPSVTGGTLTATGGVTSNEAGTHYWQVNTSATPITIPATGAMTGWNSRTLTVGAQTFSLGVMSAGSVYYLHQAAQDSSGNRTTTDLVTGPFTVNQAGDTTPPVLTGSISVSSLTNTSYVLAWPAGTDDVGIQGYDYSLDGGVNWITLGNVLTVSVTGRTAGATDLVRVRARDAANNLSTPVLSTTVTLPSVADTTPPTLTGTITVSGVSNTGYTVTSPVATDNVAVTGYQYRINSGTWTTIAGGSRVAVVTGRPASTADTVQMRAFDAAGNFSSALSVTATTTASPTTYSVVSSKCYLNTGSAHQTNKVVSYSLFFGGDIGSLTGISPREGTGTFNGTTGSLTITGIPVAGPCMLLMKDADGGIYYELVTAA